MSDFWASLSLPQSTSSSVNGCDATSSGSGSASSTHSAGSTSFLQYSSYPSSSSYNSSSSSSLPPLSTSQQQLNPKSSHLSRRNIPSACDACRRRKQGCDKERPCKRCLEKDIQCTYILKDQATLRGYSSLASLNASAPVIDTRSSTPALSYASSLSPPSPGPFFSDLQSSSALTGGTGAASRSTASRQSRGLRRAPSMASLKEHAEFQPNLPQRSGSWQTVESSLPSFDSLSSLPPSRSASRAGSTSYASFNVLDDLGSFPGVPIQPRAIRKSAANENLKGPSQYPSMGLSGAQNLPPSRRGASGVASSWNSLPGLTTSGLNEYGSSGSLDSGYVSSLPASALSSQPASSAATPYRTAPSHPTAEPFPLYNPFASAADIDTKPLMDSKPSLSRKAGFVNLSSGALSSSLYPSPQHGSSAQYASQGPLDPYTPLASIGSYANTPMLSSRGSINRSHSPSPMKSMPQLSSRSGSTSYPDLSAGFGLAGYGGLGLDSTLTSGYDSQLSSPNPRPRKMSRMVSHAGLAQYEGSGWRG